MIFETNCEINHGSFDLETLLHESYSIILSLLTTAKRIFNCRYLTWYNGSTYQKLIEPSNNAFHDGQFDDRLFAKNFESVQNDEIWSSLGR